MVWKKNWQFCAVSFTALYGSKGCLFRDKVLSAQLCVWKKVRNLMLVWIISLSADVPVQTRDRVGTITTHLQTQVNKAESSEILRPPSWRGRSKKKEGEEEEAARDELVENGASGCFSGEAAKSSTSRALGRNLEVTQQPPRTRRGAGLKWVWGAFEGGRNVPRRLK